MIVSARGLAVKSVKYGESRNIASVYTDWQGMRSFVVRSGAGGRKSSTRSYFFPLHQLEISFENRNTDLLYIKDVKPAYIYKTLYTDINKSGMVFFMAEVLGKCIREPLADEGFFERLWEGLRQLDDAVDGYADFHLYFLLEMASLLGVYPVEIPEEKPLLDRLGEAHAAAGGYGPRVLSRNERSRLIGPLGNYCCEHGGVQGGLKSLDVLQQLYAIQ